MAEYRLNATPSNVTRTIDGAHIPNHPDNRDWQEYQRWLADGGVPDPYIAPLPSPNYDWGPMFVDVIGRKE